MDVGSSRYYGMDHLGLSVDPNVGLHAKNHWLPFLVSRMSVVAASLHVA